MACSVLGSPTPTPPVTAPPTASLAGQTPTGLTPPAAQTSTAGGPNNTGPTPPADLGTTPISTATTGPAPVGAKLSSSGKAETPRLAFDAAGTLHLVWFDTSVRGTGDYFHRQKAANGDWSKAESLTTDFD